MSDTPLARIESYLNGTRLMGWHFASDGKWDAAERIMFDAPLMANLTAIQTWLSNQATSDIALEALFETEKYERFLFGIRISHLSLEEKEKAIGNIVGICRRNESLNAVVQKIRDALKDQTLATLRPEYLELGVFDWWNRVKSLIVWHSNEPQNLATPDAIAALAEAPDKGFPALYKPQNKPLMLEAAWARNPTIDTSFQAWVSLPVSEFGITPDRHTLSPEKYRIAASTFIGQGL